MARIARETKRYPTDLTDEGWVLIQPFLPKVARRGRRPRTDLREVLNALDVVALPFMDGPPLTESYLLSSSA